MTCTVHILQMTKLIIILNILIFEIIYDNYNYVRIVSEEGENAKKLDFAVKGKAKLMKKSINDLLQILVTLFSKHRVNSQ